jgi:hypothetical protein
MIQRILDDGAGGVTQVQAVLEEGSELAEVVACAGHPDVRRGAALYLRAGYGVVVGRPFRLYVEPGKQAVVTVAPHVAEVLPWPLSHSLVSLTCKQSPSLALKTSGSYSPWARTRATVCSGVSPGLETA